ncbi:MAG: signal recognition particle protein [Burkholderiales bacterium]|nr:signal recognition particle protein [Burkholderiales bacterium]
MLENLTSRLSRVVKTLRGEARLTEANMAEMLREVRMALLEADVALPVVRDLIARIKEKAAGTEVVGSLTPGQALVGVVNAELAAIMGDAARELNFATKPPAVILLAGLQGAGKTTSAGKLAKLVREQYRKKVLTVSTDVYRPAAIKQLETVSAQAGVDFYPATPGEKPVDIATAALNKARTQFHDVLIVDTAGRLGVDTAMMEEIRALHAALDPVETLFVVDAMLGQDAVNTAKAFGDALPLTGVILTKLDGDARGGAALSVRHITGAPIKFAGTGEKLGGFEVFHPERMAGRILGMGDILSLVEEAHRGVDLEAAKKVADKIRTGERFDLEDFKSQIGQMRKMGGLSTFMDKLPAQFAQAAQGADLDRAEREVRRMEGIINSMTPQERIHPDLIKAKRKQRIAKGAGVPVQEVNRLLKQFEQMRTMMKQMKQGGLAKMMRGMGRFMGGSLPGMR